MSGYTYTGAPAHNQGADGTSRFTLTDGEHPFRVGEVGELAQSARGNWVLRVRLEVGANNVFVWDYPSAGTDKNGEAYDKIAPFLMALGVRLEAGKSPDLRARALVGKSGRVIIRHEEYQGQMRPRVARYVIPGETPEAPKAAPAPAPAPASSQDNDDLPF